MERLLLCPVEWLRLTHRGDSREIIGPQDALLEFETEIDGIVINGVDLIKWNDAGRVVEFKVMVRPLKAIQLVHQRMAAMLESTMGAR